MSANAGNLLWSRQRLSLPAGTTDVDTGITQQQLGFGNSSVNEPPLGIPGTSAPAPGATPASRVMVIPEPPTSAWSLITHSEPYFDTDTGTVHVTFTNANEVTEFPNVFFWCPATNVGPGQADTYNPLS